MKKMEKQDICFCYFGYYFTWTYVIVATDEELKNKIVEITKKLLSEYDNKPKETFSRDDFIKYIRLTNGLEHPEKIVEQMKIMAYFEKEDALSLRK